MPLTKFAENDIQQHLSELNAGKKETWVIDDEKLTKVFKFPDFIHAFSFMTKCAIYVEKMNHHPEWCNVYNSVRVQLTTHEVSGISEKDFNLAKMMDVFYL